jgi:hypothetical protein
MRGDFTGMYGQRRRQRRVEVLRPCSLRLCIWNKILSKLALNRSTSAPGLTFGLMTYDWIQPHAEGATRLDNGETDIDEHHM